MATRMWVEAKDVKTGDFLPGLDNGYVAEDPEPASECVSLVSGRQYVAVNEDAVFITYHDSQGSECYLILPEDSAVQVER